MDVFFGSIDAYISGLHMPEFIADAIIDTIHMIPFLLVIFIVVELLERRYGKEMQHGIERAAAAGPLLGALFGCVPQCGFSIIATALYTKKIITLGTLIAVYISTSDEAIPVILSQPDKAHLVITLILTKLVIATIAGYSIDLIGKYKRGKTCEHHHHDHDEELDPSEDSGCCSHTITGSRARLKSLMHPLIHTAKITFFVLIVTLGINYLVESAGGEKNLGRLLLSGSFLQPIIAALFGLIPNCAASVAITLAYLNGGISFGSVISGLSASAGLGLLVLIKEDHDIKDVLKIAGLLVGISSAVGILLQLFKV
jgi:hypothetical protein